MCKNCAKIELVSDCESDEGNVPEERSSVRLIGDRRLDVRVQIDRDDAATIRTALGRHHVLVLLQVVERNRLVHRTRQQPIAFHRDAKRQLVSLKTDVDTPRGTV